MSEIPERITWEPHVFEKFEKILLQVPALIRGIAETRVSKKAESLVRESQRGLISEKDMVDAFFAETPEGFLPAMKTSMREMNIDYVHYGYQD